MTGEQKPGGLEVVVWLTTGGDVTRSEAYAKDQSVNDLANYPVALTPAEPAEARIRDMADQLVAEIEAHGNTFENLRQAEARATAAEAKLARAVEVIGKLVAEVESFDRAPDNARIWIGGWSTYSGVRDPSLVHVGKVRQTLAALQAEAAG